MYVHMSQYNHIFLVSGFMYTSISTLFNIQFNTSILSEAYNKLMNIRLIIYLNYNTLLYACVFLKYE